MDVDAPKLRLKPGEKKEEIDEDDPRKHICRFCTQRYEKAQALGGHMNRHKEERKKEELDKARELVGVQHFGGPLYNMPGGSGLATLHQGGDIMMPNLPLVGVSSRPYLPSNQQLDLQNWQFNQLLQTSYSLQSQSQAPGGSFHSSQASTRPQARVNPGQRQMAQEQQPGADFGSHSQGPFREEPSPLDEVVLGSNPINDAMPSFPPHGAS